MTALHFFAPDVEGERVTLAGEEARHAVRVLRVRPGERISVSDGAGAWVDARVIEAGNVLVAEVLERRCVPAAHPEVWVFQALPKSGKLEVVVERLTEIGIGSIRPFRAGRSVSRWGEAKASAQLGRLRAVALSAAKQSRRAWLPAVEAPVGMDELALPDPTFVLHQDADRRLVAALPTKPPDHLGLVVGPEGGFTAEEVSALAKAGGRPVGMGSLVLRTETAALVAASIVLSRYGVLG